MRFLVTLINYDDVSRVYVAAGRKGYEPFISFNPNEPEEIEGNRRGWEYTQTNYICQTIEEAEGLAEQLSVKNPTTNVVISDIKSIYQVPKNFKPEKTVLSEKGKLPG